MDEYGEDGFYDEVSSQEEPEPQQQAAPQVDIERDVRERYIAPLEREVSDLKAVLDPNRIQAFQQQQNFVQQRAQAAHRFRQALEDGDPMAAFTALAPQFGMWDRAHMAQAQAYQQLQQRFEEQEQLRQITQEVEEEEIHFYASDPEGGQLLREFVPLCARDYAEQRAGAGAKPNREDVKAAKAWMEHLFSQKSFFDAATEMVGHVRARKAATQPQQTRRFPTSPAPGARTRQRPTEDQDFYNLFYS